MTFTEAPFWILTAVTFALWRACRQSERGRAAVMLAASVVFYGFHHWPLLFLLLAYCLVDWGAAVWIARSKRPHWPLALGVGFNLLVLAYWKYTPLLLRTFERWFALVESSVAGTAPAAAVATAPMSDWIIPFGISFYAFTGIAYVVDVYRGVTPAEKSFLRYVLSAIFFPHLVAGPILRPHEFLEKLRPGRLPDRPEAPLEALHLLAVGLFKKLVVADRIALAIDPFFSHVADASTAGVWSLPYVYLYALQIYFDFSGYTDIARGLGLMFGFRWPENFDAPYLATSIKDFWRRWHITLSSFLKDYLYVPLGGNRRGRLLTYRNLMLTMLLGGLWHGASWSFMVWGGLHGLYLVVNGLWSETAAARRLRALSGLPAMLYRAACVVLTFHAVCLAWCFFRLSVFGESVTCIRKCFEFDAGKVWVGGAANASLWWLTASFAVFALVARRYRSSLAEPDASASQPQLDPLARGFLWGTGAAVVVLAVLLSPAGEKPPFIYFQF